MENLNIEYHFKILVREALRRNGSPKKASKYLEISDRTVHRYMKKFNLDKNGKDTTIVQRCCQVDSLIPSRVRTDGLAKGN